MILNKFRSVRLLEKSPKEVTSSKQRKKIRICSKSRKPEHRQSDLNATQKLESQRPEDAIQCVTDEQLIICCLAESTSNLYWGEFYRRFNRLIDKKILKTLYKINVPCTQAVADEISEAVVMKLHSQRFLEIAKKHENINTLLIITVGNVVLDWNRQRKRKKNAMEYAVETSMMSLEHLIARGDGEVTLGETIADPEKDPQYKDHLEEMREDAEYLQKLIDNLGGIKRLVFKVKMMFDMPLSEKDIQEIARLKKIKPEIITQEVDKIINDLAQKKIAHLKKRQRLYNQEEFLTRLQYRLDELDKCPDTPAVKKHTLKKKIDVQTTLLGNARRRIGTGNVHPSAKQIANLLGISQNAVGVRLYEARDILKSQWQTAFNEKQNQSL